MNRVISAFFGCFYNSIIIIPIRRAEQEHFIPCQVFDFFVDFHQFGFFFTVGELAHILVILTVVSKVVSFSQNHFHIIRVMFYPSTRHKEGYFDIMFLENLHDLLGIFIAPGCIKSQSYFGFLSFHTIDGQFSVSDSGACRDTLSDSHKSGQDEKCSSHRDDFTTNFFLTNRIYDIIPF